MAIPVVCTCGEHFDARDDQAAQWAFCPACGDPVTVPGQRRRRSIRTDQTGVPDVRVPEPPPPAHFRLRRRQPDPNLAAKGLWVPLEAEVRPTPEQREEKAEKRKARRAGWSLETYWPECLGYPFRVGVPVAGLGAALGVLLLLGTLYVPTTSPMPGWAAVTAATVVVGTYTLAFLLDVLTSAAAGEHGKVRWTRLNAHRLFRGCLTWLLGFLAGPVVYAGVACWFAPQVGDLNWLDLSILAELTVVAVGCWLVNVLAAVEQNTLVARARHAVGLARRLGYRGLLTFLAAPLLLYVPGAFYIEALQEYRRDRVAGTVLAICAGVTALYLATFYLRYLGLLAFRTRLPANDG